MDVSPHYRGVLYPTANKSKVMIIVTGSDGGSKWANQIAKVFSQKGVPSYALAYWGEKSLPSTLSKISIEIIEHAVQTLKEQGYKKVGIYGFSKGAELALSAASRIPSIEFVIAVSPSCCVFEGIAKPKYSGESSWTWNGEPLPYVSFNKVEGNLVKSVLKNRELGFTAQYIEALNLEKNEENTIKVENINGPILLLSPKEDAQWPSAKMSALIEERLVNKQFPFPVTHEIFQPASHILCPVQSWLRYAYKIERTYPRQCQRAREQALEKTLDWLKLHPK